MLSWLAFGNLVNFNGTQKLKFANWEEGRLGLFIGENGSGKSAIFEIIRRAVSRNINVSMTNLCDKDKDAFIVCKFDYSEEVQRVLRTNLKFADEMFLNGVQENGKSMFDVIKHDDIECIYSIVYFPKNQPLPQGNHTPRQIFKAFAMQIRDSRDVILAEHGKLDGQNYKFRPIVPKNIDEISQCLSQIDTKQDIASTQDFFDQIQKQNQLSTIARPLFCVNNRVTDCERLSSILLEPAIVFTFGHTGISPVVWSKGCGPKDSNNYHEAVLRADILKTLLPREIPEDRLTFEATFGYKFCLTNRTSCMIDIEVTDLQYPDNPFPLLKCPEGILPAKMVTLLVSEKTYFTVCVEEPDRTMHPQMIGQIRKLLIKKSKTKTILLTTHSSEWITPRTISATVLCRKGTSSMDATAIHISSIMHQNLTSYVSRKHVRNVFLARRVLCVEGITDESIVNAILALISDEFADAIQPPFVVAVLGMGSIADFCKACESLRTVCKVLCDCDVIMKKTEDSKIVSKLEAIAQFDREIDAENMKTAIECCKNLSVELSKKVNKTYNFLNYAKKVQTIIHEICRVYDAEEARTLVKATSPFLTPHTHLNSTYPQNVDDLRKNVEKYLNIFTTCQDVRVAMMNISTIEPLFSTLDSIGVNIEALNKDEKDDNTLCHLERIWNDMVTNVKNVYSMFIFKEPDPRSFPNIAKRNLKTVISTYPSLESNGDIFNHLERNSVFSWRSGDLEDMIAMSPGSRFLPLTKAELTTAKQKHLDALVKDLMENSKEFKSFKTFVLRSE